MDSGEGRFAGERGEVVGRALRGKLAFLCDWSLFIGKNPSLDWDRFRRYTDEFGVLRFAQSMTRLSCRLLGASVPFELPMDEEADELLESSLWDIPSATTGGKSLFQRRLGIRQLPFIFEKY